MALTEVWPGVSILASWVSQSSNLTALRPRVMTNRTALATIQATNRMAAADRIRGKNPRISSSTELIGAAAAPSWRTLRMATKTNSRIK